VGVLLTLIFGILLGGVSGYYGGSTDNLIQRGIEVIRSMPTIPLWMGLAAALPRDWTVVQTYFAITIVLSLFGWTDLARVVRGRFLSLRDEDFVAAAEIAGASQARIIFRHMLPSFLSHIIATVTLRVPGMIISETALSFLGLGMRPPAVSWGVLLQAAQNIQTIGLAPWLMTPAAAVIIVVLAFNFLGDGLRDAADPYQ
jgi:peptide/nickel transport system permease protein